jgi:hypothetical protein
MSEQLASPDWCVGYNCYVNRGSVRPKYEG